MGKRSANTVHHSKIQNNVVDNVSSEDESEYSDVEENNNLIVSNEVVMDGEVSEDEVVIEEEEEEEIELQPVKKGLKNLQLLLLLLLLKTTTMEAVKRENQIINNCLKLKSPPSNEPKKFKNHTCRRIRLARELPTVRKPL